MENNDNRSLLHGMNGWSQLFFFIFLTVSGFMLAITVIQLSIDITQMEQSSRIMRMALMIQSVCIFLLPALAFTYLCHEKPGEYLKTERYRNISLLLLSILLIIIIQPTVDCIGYYNQQLTLPESMHSVENWMKESESSAKETVNLLFGDKTITGLIFNLLVIAIVAGLAEELFFRGCLQQIIQKIVVNKHATVWIAAAIFSAIHFQFYGFVPRMLLGAILGYLFIWSGNIWVPVIVHTANNAIGVIFPFIYYGTPEYEKFGSFNPEHNWEGVIISLILSCLILFYIYRKRKAVTEIKD